MFNAHTFSIKWTGGTTPHGISHGGASDVLFQGRRLGPCPWQVIFLSAFLSSKLHHNYRPFTFLGVTVCQFLLIPCLSNYACKVTLYIISTSTKWKLTTCPVETFQKHTWHNISKNRESHDNVTNKCMDETTVTNMPGLFKLQSKRGSTVLSTCLTNVGFVTCNLIL